MNEVNNPFKKLSELFLDNQNSFNKETQQLRTSLRSINGVLNKLLEELENDPFNANLNTLRGLDVFSMQILEQGKTLETSRDKIIESIRILKKANDKKLNS